MKNTINPPKMRMTDLRPASKQVEIILLLFLHKISFYRFSVTASVPKREAGDTSQFLRPGSPAVSLNPDS